MKSSRYKELINDFLHDLSFEYGKKDETYLLKLTISNYLASKTYDKENFFVDCIQQAKLFDTRLLSFLNDSNKKYNNNYVELARFFIEEHNIKELTELVSTYNVDLSQVIEIPKQYSKPLKNTFSLWKSEFPWSEQQHYFNQASQMQLEFKTIGYGIDKLRASNGKNIDVETNILNGNLKFIKNFIQEGGNIYVDNDYYLQLAISHNKTDIIKYFLKQGCLPTQENSLKLLDNSIHNDPDLFKEYIIAGVLNVQDKNRYNLFVKQLFKYIDEQEEKIIEHNKQIKMDNCVYQLHKEYCNNYHRHNFQKKNNSDKKLEEKNSSPNNAFTSFLNLVAHKPDLPIEEKEEENEKITKDELLKPLTPLTVTENIQKSIKRVNEIRSLENTSKNKKIDNLEQPRKKIVKKFINLNGEEISQKELQAQWDKQLILGFANDYKFNMRVFIAKFTQDNHITLDLLNANDIKLKRFPIQKIYSHFELTPYVFVCKHLPKVREILFQPTFTKLKSDIDFYTKKLGLLKDDIVSFTANSSMKEDIKELKEASAISAKAKQMRAIYSYQKEEYSKHNWNKVK